MKQITDSKVFQSKKSDEQIFYERKNEELFMIISHLKTWKIGKYIIVLEGYPFLGILFRWSEHPFYSSRNLIISCANCEVPV